MTYQVKKKKPVVRAGYRLKNPTGATFSSLRQKTHKYDINEYSVETEFTESERIKRTSPGGIVSFCSGETRTEEWNTFLKHWGAKLRTKLSSPYEVPAIGDWSDRFHGEEGSIGERNPMEFVESGEGGESGGAWQHSWLHEDQNVEKDDKQVESDIWTMLLAAGMFLFC